MNERIRELHRQVMLWSDTTDCPDTVEWKFDQIPEEYTKKFAELIVKEMCGMMEQCQDDISSLEPSEVNWGYVSQLGNWIERFKKHFGVTE